MNHLVLVLFILLSYSAAAPAAEFKKFKIQVEDEAIEGRPINHYAVTFELPEDWAEGHFLKKNVEGVDYFADEGIVSDIDFKKCFPEKKRCVVYSISVSRFVPYPNPKMTPMEKLKKELDSEKECSHSYPRKLRVSGIEAAGAVVCQEDKMPKASFQASHTRITAYYYNSKVDAIIYGQEIWQDASVDNKEREESRPIFYKDWQFNDLHDRVLNSVSLEFKPGKIYHRAKRK